jgi:hypothetical protein
MQQVLAELGLEVTDVKQNKIRTGMVLTLKSGGAVIVFNSGSFMLSGNDASVYKKFIEEQANKMGFLPKKYISSSKGVSVPYIPNEMKGKGYFTHRPKSPPDSVYIKEAEVKNDVKNEEPKSVLEVDSDPEVKTAPEPKINASAAHVVKVLKTPKEAEPLKLNRCMKSILTPQKWMHKTPRMNAIMAQQQLEILTTTAMLLLRQAKEARKSVDAILQNGRS